MDSVSACTCHKRFPLILETSFLTQEVPLRCGECFGTFPFYRFGHTVEHGTYEDILEWKRLYDSFHRIWIHSGVGEQFAYRQLARLDSRVSQQGRETCRRIELRSGRPTYYYLYRYHGRSKAAERKRRCPGCGQTWLLETPWQSHHDFRCDRCRLTSSIGFDVR